MTFTEFKDSFNNEILEKKAGNPKKNLHTCFTENYFNELVNADILPEIEYLFFDSKTKDGSEIKVDGYYYDSFDRSLTMIAGCYIKETINGTLQPEKAETVLSYMSRFIELAGITNELKTTGKAPVNDLVELLTVQSDSISKIKLLVVSNVAASGKLHSVPSLTLRGITAERQIWGLDRLYDVLSSGSGRQEISIDFREYMSGSGIPCIEANSVGQDEFRSFLCVIPGEVLADIYDDYGALLLEGNVRSFLSSKVAVNKKIRSTILSQPEYFFAYNNGVAATATELVFSDTKEGKQIIGAQDFQIINGGQTTASLFNARFKDGANLSEIYVQMKLTEINTTPEKALELVHNISRSSNSQNKVTDADFFATHPFHVRMDELSKQCIAPASEKYPRETRWYYERARGQFNQEQMKMSKVERSAFLAENPKDQLITKTDLAKYINSWNKKPQLVSKGAQTNFIQFAEEIDEKWNNHSDEYNEHYFKESVALAILFKHTEDLVTDQPWFQNGYRANIVAYTLALLHLLIEEQCDGDDLDLIKIWEKQSVPSAVTDVLTDLTFYVFETITEENRETVNVGQWCKRENCWKQVKECDYILPDSIFDCLKSAEEANEEKKEASEIQELKGDVDMQMFIVNKGSEYWKKVNDFIVQKKFSIMPKQTQALTYAIKGSLLSPAQSKLLIDLLRLIIDEGFKE